MFCLKKIVTETVIVFISFDKQFFFCNRDCEDDRKHYEVKIPKYEMEIIVRKANHYSST